MGEQHFAIAANADGARLFSTNQNSISIIDERVKDGPDTAIFVTMGFVQW